MEKLWGHPSLPVKTRLSRLYVALAAALTLAGTVGAAYAEGIEDISVENGEKRVSVTDNVGLGLVSGKGSEWRVSSSLNIFGGLDVLDGGKVITSSLYVDERADDGRETRDIYVSGAGSHLYVENSRTVDVLALADHGRFSNGNKQLNVDGLLVIGSRASFDGHSVSDELEKGKAWTMPTLGEAQAPGELSSDIVVNTNTYTYGMWHSIIFNHTADDYRFANTVIGDGAIMNVAGNTELTGDLSRYNGHVFVKGGKLAINSDMGTVEDFLIRYQDLTVEDGGTLLLNGTMGREADQSLGGGGFSTYLFVKSGGVLSGNATIGRTNVEGGGHISPGDGGIGKFDINGYLTFKDGAFYDVDITADGRSDTLAVSDKATIGNNVKVLINTLDPHTSYQNGQTYRILTSGKNIDGTFSEAVLDSAFLDASLTNDEKYVDLTIRQKDAGGNTGGGKEVGGDDGSHNGSDDGNTGGGDDGDIGGGKPDVPGIFQTVATSDNQWNTAGALSSLAQQGPSLGLYNSLLMLNAGQAREAFNQLSGEQYASVQSSLQQSGTLVGSVVNQHMQTMFDGDSLTVPPLAMSLVQGPERERNGAWGQMFGSWTRSKGDGNTGKLDSNTGGFLVGADRELSDGVRAGAYAGYSRTHFDVDSRASSGHSNNYHLGLYGAGQRDALALRGGLGYSWHRIESERNVGFGGYSDRLKGDYDGNTLQAFTELGYQLRYESSSVEPFVNLSYVRLHTDAVQEQGGAAALSVQDETMNTFYSTLGLRGATDIPVSGVDVTLHGNLGWQHAYGDTDTSARMAFATGDSFATKGAPVDKDVAVVGVGLDVPLTRSTRVGVSYQGQYGSQLQANSVNAQLTVSF